MIITVAAHDKGVSSLAVIGSYCVSSSYDTTLGVWDCENFSCLARVEDVQLSMLVLGEKELIGRSVQATLPATA